MFRSTRSISLVVALAGVLSACSDNTNPRSALVPTEAAGRRAPNSLGVFQRYVALGTSISAGVQGDGLVASTQVTSWPEQLAVAAGRSLSLPLIDGAGCRSPLVAPLARGVRV